MIPESILKIPKYGVWGLHSSLLQNMEEEHPWFGLKSGGKKSTGVTLFKMKKGVDNGEIIGQCEFDIRKTDTIKELIDKSIKASKKLLLKYINEEKIIYTKQNESSLDFSSTVPIRWRD